MEKPHRVKPEHRKYIEGHINKKSIHQIAEDLGLKGEKAREHIEDEMKRAEAATASAEAASPGGRAARALAVSFLLAAVWVVYANSIGGDFFLDDELLVRDNPLIHSPSRLPALFKKDIFARAVDAKPVSNSYRPLQMATYAIDVFLWGGGPRGFHLSNVFIHLLSTLLIFLLVKRVSKDFFIAYFVSLLFGIHPVNTACVSYISGRADILAAACMLASALCYIGYFEGGRKALLFVSILSYACAVYSKEYAIFALPCILLLYSAVFDTRRIARLGSLIFYIVPLLFYVPMRMQALSALTSKRLELSQLSLFPRVFTSLKTLFIDMRILFLPYDLHFGRTTKVERSTFGSPSALLTVLGIIACGMLLRWLWGKWRRGHMVECGMGLFGISWFLVSMLPLLNIVPLQVFHADSWLYFPSIGAYMAIASLLYSVRRLLAGRTIFLRGIAFFLIALAFLVYGFVTIKRNEDYRDGVTFYLANLKWRPSVKLYTNLGALYGSKKDYGNAIKYLKKAIEVNRVYPSANVIDAYYNLGLTYMQLRRYEDASQAFEKVLLSNNEELKQEARRFLSSMKR